MLANLENSAVASPGKGIIHSNPKERQCQRKFKLPHNCTDFTHQQSNAQNSPSQASAVSEPRTSRCTSWIQKRQRNQRSNCQHPVDHRKQENSRKTSTSVSLTTLKPLGMWITTNCGKFFYLSPEKLVCGSRSNSQNLTQNYGLIKNWKRSISRLYIVTQLICRVYHVKCWDG